MLHVYRPDRPEAHGGRDDVAPPSPSESPWRLRDPGERAALAATREAMAEAIEAAYPGPANVAIRFRLLIALGLNADDRERAGDWLYERLHGFARVQLACGLVDGDGRAVPDAEVARLTMTPGQYARWEATRALRATG